MISSQTRIFTVKGLKTSHEVSSNDEFYTVKFDSKSQARFLQTSPGALPWVESTPQEIAKITVGSDFIYCTTEQKLYIEYGSYGIKIITVSKLVVGDSILRLAENHYYNYCQDDYQDYESDDVYRIVAEPITSIDFYDSKDYPSMDFYKTYVQTNNNFIANGFLLIC
jgi:hypothetical protein